jgi:hypothetical protein
MSRLFDFRIIKRVAMCGMVRIGTSLMSIVQTYSYETIVDFAFPYFRYRVLKVESDVHFKKRRKSGTALRRSDSFSVYKVLLTAVWETLFGLKLEVCFG